MCEYLKCSWKRSQNNFKYIKQTKLNRRNKKLNFLVITMIITMNYYYTKLTLNRKDSFLIKTRNFNSWNDQWFMYLSHLRVKIQQKVPQKISNKRTFSKKKTNGYLLPWPICIGYQFYHGIYQKISSFSWPYYFCPIWLT